MSLAGLDRLRLEVAAIPVELGDLEVTRDDLEAQCRGALRSAYVDLDGRGDDPVLTLKLYWMSAEAVPDAVGYVASLRLSQSVRVDRVAQRLSVPTFALVAGNIESRADLAASLEQAVKALLHNFVDARRLGSEAIEQGDHSAADG